MKNLVVACLLSAICCACRKLPPSFTRCNASAADFDSCLTAAVPAAIRQLKTPLPRVRLPSLDPLEIPAMSIAPGPGVLHYQQNYTNMKLAGFTDIACESVKMSFEMARMTMRCSTPQIRVDTEYFFNGTIMVLPLYGNGTGSIVFDRLKCFHQFDFEEYEKKGKKYLKVVNSSLSIDPEWITFKFDNLYDGDQVLGDNVNLVMNDNWREIFADAQPSIEEGFTLVFSYLFNNLLSRVPLSELFDR
ncbi:hypothetical protein MTP99_006476 [Tenebrio molitor]|jgi:hypothetical protein|nr:hypothetical protein MTP99_006476 [Tenebrio molitor]CAH1382508.1 unnamed protein product [Tenebrio molitor]